MAEVVDRGRGPAIFPAMTQRQRHAAQHRPPSLRWTPVNYGLMGAGLASVTAGFVLLASASTVAAPLLLTLGYAVLIPLGIIR
ncbi:MAG: hypothetical protein ACOC3J_07045 [Gemmatimonadota bacterium]